MNLLGMALEQWNRPEGAANSVRRWTLQRYDETRGVFVDDRSTDSATEAARIFRQGPEWRVIDNVVRDIAAEYVPYQMGHVAPPLKFRDALWQAEYSPRYRFAQQVEAESAQAHPPVLPRQASAAPLQRVEPAATTALVDALQMLRVAMARIADEAGDVAEWNEGGEYYEACRLADRALEAHGRKPDPFGPIAQHVESAPELDECQTGGLRP